MKLLYFAAALVAYSANSEQLFVSPNGAGATNGLGWENAWAYDQFNNATNWAAADGKIGAGDTVYFSGGSAGETYSGNLNFRGSGSVDARITIKPGASHSTLASGHDGVVTIAGSVEDNFNGYVDLDGSWEGFPSVADAEDAGQLVESHYKFVVTNPSGQGIHYKDRDGIWVTAVAVLRCGTTGSANHGFYSNPNAGSEPIGVVIEKCLIADNLGDGINNTQNDASSTTNTVIRLCHIVGNVQDGVQAACGMTLSQCFMDGEGTQPGEHGDGWQAASGGNMVADGNIFRAWPQTIFIESSGSDADMTNIRISNNSFYYASNFGYMAGLLIYAKFTSDNVIVGFTNLIIANNTFYGLTNRNQFKLGLNQVVPTTNGTCRVRTSLVANNIFFNSDPSYLPVNIESLDTTEGDFRVQTNIFFGNTGIDWSGTSYANPAAMEAALPSFTGNTTGEPLFVSAPENLRIADGDTVALDHGADLQSLFTVDATGSTRIAPWDIGAYEYLGRRASVGTVNVGNLTITP
ncbi:MAG: hypothetical protein WAT23_19420 [Chromatiaceae bacterium]